MASEVFLAVLGPHPVFLSFYETHPVFREHVALYDVVLIWCLVGSPEYNTQIGEKLGIYS